MEPLQSNELEPIPEIQISTATASTDENGQEVMQVLVLHLDLFMCGICGKQSTDILDHMLHKSQHPTSTMYPCELCKSLYPCRQALLQHYSGSHRLLKLQQISSNHVNPGRGPHVVVNATKSVPETEHEYLSWKVDEDLDKDAALERDQCAEKASFLYTELDHSSAVDLVVHDHGLFCEKEKKESFGSREYTASAKSSSRARSKQLLKSAKRTLTHAKGPFFTPEVMSTHSSGSQASCARTMLRKPPILQRHPVATTELRKPSVHSSVQPQLKAKVKRKSSTSTGTGMSMIEFIEKVDVKEAPPLDPPSLMKTEEQVQCLHCDFASHNRDELSHHMNTKHKQVLELPDSLRPIASVEESPIKKDPVDLVDRNEDTGLVERKTRKARQPRKVERQDLPGVYPCNQCGKSFQRLRYLRKHAHVHRNEKTFVCEECGKIFKCKGYLRVHQRKMHEGEEKVFKCNQCEFESTINAAIHAHRQIHSQGSVLCDICGYAYTDKATLAKHKRVHDPRRPFACNFPGCTWRFKTEIMCKAHIRAHTTEGKFRCAYCGYVFRHKHHLQRHEANMHGVKHDKSRPSNAKDPYSGLYTTYTQEVEDSVNIIETTDLGEEQMLDDGQLPPQYMIIEPDGTDTLIDYDGCDLSSLSANYISLSHTNGQTDIMLSANDSKVQSALCND